jgi:hypothetical protein
MTNRIKSFFEQPDAGSNPDILRARLLTAIAEKLTNGPADGPLAAYGARLFRLQQAMNEAHELLASLAKAKLCAETAARASGQAMLVLLEEVRQQPALLKLLGIQ